MRDKVEEKMPKDEFIKEYAKELAGQLDLARRNLQFEKAAQIKKVIDEIRARSAESGISN